MTDSNRIANGSLDPRRWQRWKAERDDLPLFQEHENDDRSTSVNQLPPFKEQRKGRLVLASGEGAVGAIYRPGSGLI
jgi:hypothetical protein